MNEPTVSSQRTRIWGAYTPPEPLVRHDYPLSVSDASFGTAIRLALKTMPYAFARLGILLGVTLASLAWWVVTLAGTALLIAKAHEWAGYAWLFFGLFVYGLAWRTLVR